MRRAFLIAGKTWNYRNYLSDMYWKWISELKCYAKLSALCDEESAKEIIREVEHICGSFQGLQWKEVPAEQILKHFPREFELDKNNAMPYSIVEEIVGQRQFDDTLELLYKLGTKIWIFKVNYTDSKLVRETNDQLYKEIPNADYRRIRAIKFNWHAESKSWITSGEIARNLLEQKLQKKYEAYIMDKVLATAFEDVDEILNNIANSSAGTESSDSANSDAETNEEKES